MEQQMLLTAEADSAEVMKCVEDCERCHRLCVRTAMTHCLEQGGEHVEPPHFRLMLVCADICRATADAMLAGFALYEDLCVVCARVCAECMHSCRRIEDLADCADACQRCAESCTRVSGAAPGSRRAEQRIPAQLARVARNEPARADPRTI